MAQLIEHTGIVERTDAGRVTVRIVAQSACGTCAARAACGMSEAQEKRVEVTTPRAAEYAPGDEVVVGVRRNAAGLAVAAGYGGALAVLVAALAGSKAAGCSDGAAALWSLGAVALYYGVLAAARKKIDEKIHFTITKR